MSNTQHLSENKLASFSLRDFSEIANEYQAYGLKRGSRSLVLSLFFGERKEEDIFQCVVFRSAIYIITKCDFMVKQDEININFGAKIAICSSWSLQKMLKSKQQVRLLEASLPRSSQVLPPGTKRRPAHHSWSGLLKVLPWLQERKGMMPVRNRSCFGFAEMSL